MTESSILLLVEDEETIQMALQDALEEGGFEVLLAKSGNEAFSILERKAAELRGLITDVNLGDGADGWDVARRAREMMAELPVVYMSGASGHEWASHGVPNSTLLEDAIAPR